MESAEHQLYSAIHSALAKIGAGHRPKTIEVDLPKSALIGEKDDDGSMFLRITVDMEWRDFEDEYFAEIMEEIEGDAN